MIIIPEEPRYITLHGEKVDLKMWVRGVLLEESAKKQLLNLASLDFIWKWLAIMPDVHWGKGSTIGTVFATLQTLIPAAVGSDIGCGMMWLLTSLMASDLPDELLTMRLAIEEAVPNGRSNNGGPGDIGAWKDVPNRQMEVWNAHLRAGFEGLVERYPRIGRGNNLNHLGTLGSGNHFIELCVDELDRVSIMLHSGSRGIGANIGNIFVSLAKEEMHRSGIALPDANLAYLPKESPHFEGYIAAMLWAQTYAMWNRRLIMEETLAAIRGTGKLPPFEIVGEGVNCHHNYVSIEEHYGEEVLVTRKGAVRAREGEYGIIPGSMGDKSYIVRGKGNPESFHSCSHGAGRVLPRKLAERTISIEEHARATEGIECLKDKSVLDETPGAYKPIGDVMEAQRDLVEPVHTLKQRLVVKGKKIDEES